MMTSDHILYRQQATVQRAAAETATLANVKGRCEAAAAAWDKLADRADRVSAERAARPAVRTETVNGAPGVDLL